MSRAVAPTGVVTPSDLAALRARACPCGATEPAPRRGAVGRPLTWEACCGRWLLLPEALCGEGGGMALPAPTPEALMRSRYTAFVLDWREHLMATWHPDHRPEALEPPEPGLQWLGLQVGASAVHPLGDGQAQPAWADGLSGPPLSAWGEVQFVARYKLGGRAHRLVEHSVFACQDGHWTYVQALPQGASGA